MNIEADCGVNSTGRGKARGQRTHAVVVAGRWGRSPGGNRSRGRTAPRSAGGSGAYAVTDPTEDGMLVVRRSRDRVSLGAGGFPAGLADILVRHDLAARGEVGSCGRRHLAMSAPGAAHR